MKKLCFDDVVAPRREQALQSTIWKEKKKNSLFGSGFGIVADVKEYLLFVRELVPFKKTEVN